MNKSGIQKVTTTNVNQILFSVSNQQAVSIKVDNTGVSADANGKKLLKAGTPLEGNLELRSTAFKKVATAANCNAILLHDIDVTDGAANAAGLIWGFVNLDRIDSTTAALITADVKTALKGSIYFLKDK